MFVLAYNLVLCLARSPAPDPNLVSLPLRIMSFLPLRSLPLATSTDKRRIFHFPKTRCDLYLGILPSFHAIGVFRFLLTDVSLCVRTSFLRHFLFPSSGSRKMPMSRLACAPFPAAPFLLNSNPSVISFHVQDVAPVLHHRSYKPPSLRICLKVRAPSKIGFSFFPLYPFFLSYESFSFEDVQIQ